MTFSDRLSGTDFQSHFLIDCIIKDSKECSTDDYDDDDRDVWGTYASILKWALRHKDLENPNTPTHLQLKCLSPNTIMRQSGESQIALDLPYRPVLWVYQLKLLF